MISKSIYHASLVHQLQPCDDHFCLTMRFKLDDQRYLFVINCYIPPTLTVRGNKKLCNELDNIDKVFKQYCVIVMGDFNQDEDSTEIAKIKRLYGLRGTRSITPAQPTRKDNRIDFFLTKNVKTIKQETLDEISDHRAISIEVEVKAKLKRKSMISHSFKGCEKAFSTFMDRVDAMHEQLKLGVDLPKTGSPSYELAHTFAYDMFHDLNKIGSKEYLQLSDYL